jgi:pimeloyl-ACP methyl ester carboxylesterase
VRRKVTLIGVDRPGFGLSPNYKGRKLSDWPDDVARVADSLQIDKFSVLGISGGCPYALACASKIPSRLLKVGVVSGLASVDTPGALASMNFFNRKMLTLAGTFPLAATAIVNRIKRTLRSHPKVLIHWLSTVSPPCDKKILREPEVRRILSESFQAGLDCEGDGAAYELSLIARPWDFKLEAITIPVELWHGTADHYVPLCMGEAMAKALPQCRAHFVADQGHFMVISMIDEILSALT